jgi:hypothetical protein
MAVVGSVVRELSKRKTPEVRQFLELAKKRLLELKLSDDEPVENEGYEEVGNGEGYEEVGDGEESTSDLRNKEPIIVSVGNKNSSQTRSKPRVVSSEEPPDDIKKPKQLSRVRPVGTPGLPPAWMRPLDTGITLNVPADADLPQIYAAALSALISEIKRTGAGQKRFEIENGVRTESSETIYEFPFTDDAGLFEDARVEIEINGRRVSGSIVSINSGRLWLAVDEELGNTIRRAVLLVDATALLEALKLRIEGVSKGEIVLNRDLADAIVGKKEAPKESTAIPECPSTNSLDVAQQKALHGALKASLTFIWGPPGCGKTYVLAELVRSCFAAKHRVLICSNTNKAVDQVLLRVCESLGVQHPAMDEGRIVRLGTIADQKLNNVYHGYVTVEGIAERRSVELKARQNQIQSDIAQIDNASAKAQAIVDRFLQVDSAQSVVDAQHLKLNRLSDAGRQLITEFQSGERRIQQLQAELEARRKAFFTVFKRSEETIQRDLSVAVARHAKREDDLKQMQLQLSQAKGEYEQVQHERDRLRSQ